MCDIVNVMLLNEVLRNHPRCIFHHLINPSAKRTTSRSTKALHEVSQLEQGLPFQLPKVDGF